MAGTDPSRDGIMSTVSGAIVRSAGLNVFIQNFTVIPASASTKAYDLSDATGTLFCSLLAGCAVAEIGIPSLGVGQMSGFKGITLINNFWNCTDGLKVTGNIGSVAVWLSYISGISSGSAIEFLAGSTINDVDLSNNYFFFTGQTGIKVNAGATISNGRLTTNMFRGITTLLNGIDSYTYGWEMQQNTGIPNTRSFAYAYMNGNATTTTFAAVGTYAKVLGTTTLVDGKKFSGSNNRFTYIGKKDIHGRAFIALGAKAPGNATDYTIAIAKNGAVVTAPTSTLGPLINNQGFQIILETEIEFVTNDYIEVFIRSNSGTTSLTVSDLQFRVSE
ncbi:MAG: hypothetical protein K9I85_13615 [Saprospiraceae bacterium]|nr:hypothetical protein [Saprospiraceae bacterium]